MFNSTSSAACWWTFWGLRSILFRSGNGQEIEISTESRNTRVLGIRESISIRLVYIWTTIPHFAFDPTPRIIRSSFNLPRYQFLPVLVDRVRESFPRFCSQSVCSPVCTCPLDQLSADSKKRSAAVFYNEKKCWLDSRTRIIYYNPSNHLIKLSYR